ncbi:hypothetical protein KAS08_03030 [Candidatus Pacearchaeota archaeon]|nr:hypothetical protein [Candidatus Pacearchaeota archaeon]
MKLRLGIDLDDTVWKSVESVIDYYNLRNKTEYNIDDCASCSVKKLLNITEEKKRDLYDKYDNEVFSKEVILLDGFLEIFNKIQNDFEIFFITARPKNTEELVMWRMENIFGEENKNKFPLYFCGDREDDTFISKVDICKELKIDIMIDDGLHHLIECSNDGIKCLLLDYPWNRDDTLGKNIIRVNTWKDILKELKGEK